MATKIKSVFILFIIASLSACSEVAVSKLAQQSGENAEKDTLINEPIGRNNSMMTETPKLIPTHTLAPSPTAIENEHIAWKYTTGGAIWGAPATHEGVVYIGSDDGNLYAVDIATGHLNWAFQSNGIVRSQPAFGSSSGKEVVYFSSDDGNLYALDAQEGRLVWKTDIGNTTEEKIRRIIGNSPSPTGYDYVQSSPVLMNSVIYIGSADGRILAVNSDDGEVLWAYQTGAQVRATPTIEEGTVYVGSWDKSMHALDARTGELRWQVPIGGQIQTTALVVDNLVYSASRKASVIALNKVTGESVWEFFYGNNMWVESSPILRGSVLHIGSSGTRTIFGLDSQTGEMLMAYETGMFCWSKPLVIDQNLVIGCTNYNAPNHQGMYVFEITPSPSDENSLTLIPGWHLPMGESIDICGLWFGVASSPIYADGFIFFGGLDGSLYALKL